MVVVLIAAQAVTAAVVLVSTEVGVPVLTEVEGPALIRVEALAGVEVEAARDGSPAAVEDEAGELAADAAPRVEWVGPAAADVAATQDAVEAGLACSLVSVEPVVGSVCFRVGSAD